MITDPRFAPKRTDLPWLRRRKLPRNAAAADSSPAAESVHEFMSGHSTGHHHEEPAPPPPTSSGSLDLDEPAPPTPAPTPVPATSSSLDLDEPAAAPPPPRPVTPSTTSLDLDEPESEPARQAPRAAPPEESPQRRIRVDERIGPGDRMILTPADPTVTLTRLQSGIGTLYVEAAVADTVGALRLGCAYELDTDLQMIMQMTQGNRFAPPHSKRPVLVGSRDRFERVGVDLRQCRALRRFAVYAFSENRTPLGWAGTLLVTTFGGGRIEVPMDTLQGGDVAVLLSGYQVRGELVLRAEMQTLYGDVREACRAYGYDRISWLDDRTPVE